MPSARVLLVDDNASGPSLKSEWLRRSGFEVVQAATAAAALRAVEREPPDVIVLDLRVQDIDGVDVARRVRASARATGSIPILQVAAVTAPATDQTQESDHGADVCLSEPIDPDVFTATARVLLRMRRAQTTIAEALERERAARLSAEALARTRARELAAMHESLKALSTRVVRAQEEERRRVARDLHDHLGQQMTALRLHLEALGSMASTIPPLAEQTARVQQLAAEADRSLDFLAWALRPPALDDLGLQAALGHLVTAWSERFGIIAEFHTAARADVPLPPEVETHLYRIAQEALHNVAKHAAADYVSILFECSGDEAALHIEDDGRGFDADGARGIGELGLIGMRERASLAGGRITIASSPGRGTSIAVHVPIERPAAGEHARP